MLCSVLCLTNNVLDYSHTKVPNQFNQNYHPTQKYHSGLTKIPQTGLTKGTAVVLPKHQTIPQWSHQVSGVVQDGLMEVDQSQEQGEERREVWPHPRTQHCEDH